MGWRFIDDRERRDGAWNMAVDETLWRAAEEGRAEGPVLRLYEWSPPCLSLGFHQPLHRTVDLDYCRSRGFDIVRRPTGGKAVLHQFEITYCVAASVESEPFEAGPSSTYCAIAGALAASLSRLGLHVSLEQRPAASSPKDPAPCFLIPTDREVLAEGKKVVGSAQKRGRSAFLQHGAIPISLDYEALALATRNPASAQQSYRSAFAGLAEFVRDLTPEALRKVLREGFAQTFPGSWVESSLTDGERAEAERLRVSRYRDPNWQ